MLKYIISFSFLVTFSFASLIGAISITVENEPITLYEIKSFSEKNNISTKESVDTLIQRRVEDIEIKKLGIIVSPYDIDKKMKEIAKQNNLDLESFVKALQIQGIDEKTVRYDIEEQLKREILYKRVSSSKLKKPEEDELKRYYDIHKDEFNMPTKIELIEYISPRKDALELQKRQPMVNMPNISVKSKTLELKSINPQLAQLLAQTPDGSFTPVLNLGNQSGMFFIQKKSNIQNISFDMAKQQIFAKVMKEKEQAVLIEYFEKKKSETTIKIIRKPL